MRISETGIELLKQWEKCILYVYPDAGGKLTIGYGHLLTKSDIATKRFKHGITEEDASQLLAKDLTPREDVVNQCVKVPLEQCQFDALVCFVFNIGEGAFKKSTVLRVLNEHQYSQVPDAMRMWNKARGEICRGLVNRREKEIKLWKGGYNAL